MKIRIMGLIFSVVTCLLTFTKSLYVEWNELFIMIGAAAVASAVGFKNENEIKRWGKSALVGFVCCWLFGIGDLIIDHYMYFLPNGNEDGAPLTLAFKLEEYSDDLFVGSVISMIAVLVLTASFTTIRSYVSAKTV